MTNNVCASVFLQEALSALQLPDQQAKEIITSQLLPLIGQRKREDEERLAALDVCNMNLPESFFCPVSLSPHQSVCLRLSPCLQAYRDSVGRHAHQVSRNVFEVMRALALLWETHRRWSERTEDKVRGHLENLRQSQQQHVQVSPPDL